jgi:hypothetical protein
LEGVDFLMGKLLDEGLSGGLCCLENLLGDLSRLAHPNFQLRMCLLVSVTVPSAFPSSFDYFQILFNHFFKQFVDFLHIFIARFYSFLRQGAADGGDVIPQGLCWLIATLGGIGIGIRKALRPFLEAGL